MRKSALSLLLVFVIAVFAVHVLRHRGELLDDTFISFRYARNLVAGHGLVFNPGERVEGYTNFLFVMAAAACLALGLDPLAGTGALVALAALATLFAVRRLERLGPAASGPSIALLLVLPLEGFAYWSVVSFETMLFTALLVCSLVLLLREVETGRAHGAAPAFVLLALTRPEGVLAFAVANTAAFVADAQRLARWRRYLARGLVFAVLYGAYFGWRWSYYGHLVPNTFVAKVTSGSALRLSGLLYLMDWARAVPLLALAAAAPVLLLSGSVRASWRSPS